MKNNEENIDKLIRDQLNDRQFDGPHQDFLDDLNDRLDKRSKDGFFGPWNGVLDILILLLLFIWPFFNTPEGVDSYAHNNSQIDQNTYNDRTEEESDSNPTDHEENNASGSKDPIDYEMNENKEVNSHPNTIGDQEHHLMASNDSATNDESSGSDRPTNATSTSQTGSSSNESKNDQNKYNEQNKSKSKIQKSSDHSKENNKDSQSKPPKVDEPTYQYSPVYASQFNMVETKIRNWDFPSLPISHFDLSTDSSTQSNDDEESSPLAWELQVSSGLVLGRTLGKTSSINEQLLIDQSSLAPSFTFGGRVSMWLNRSVFTTGFDVLQFKEENLFEISSIESYDSVYVTNVDTTVTFDSTNQSFDTTYTYYYDSTTVTDTVNNITPVNQQYSWIQIPFQYGYRFNINKWAIIPRVGGNLALGIRQTNKLYPSAEFDQLNSYPVNSKVLLNLTGSLEVRRSFNNFHIFARGDYQTGLRPVLTGDYFERRYGGFRFNVGIGIQL